MRQTILNDLVAAMKNKDKDMSKLSEYSKKMGINEQVMEMVGMFND